MKTYKQFVNEAHSPTPDEQKVIDAWDKYMQFAPGRGWSFKGSILRSETGAVKEAAKALGVNKMEKQKVYLGTKYKVGSVDLMVSKTSKGYISFSTWSPQNSTPGIRLESVVNEQNLAWLKAEYKGFTAWANRQIKDGNKIRVGNVINISKKTLGPSGGISFNLNVKGKDILKQLQQIVKRGVVIPSISQASAKGPKGDVVSRYSTTFDPYR